MWETWRLKPQKGLFHFYKKASLVAQAIKKLPAMQETWVLSLGQDDPLENTSVFLPREFYGQRNLAGYSPWGSQKSQTQVTNTN